MQEGKPIWVESILSDTEYQEAAKKFPKSFTNGGKKISFFEGEYKWRFGMGASLSKSEILLINRRLDVILAQGGLIKETETI